MKKLSLLFFIIVFVNSLTAQQMTRVDAHNLTWNLNYTTAKELSKQQGKPILIYFTGSDWCSACKYVEQDFYAKTKYKALLDHYILYEADFPKKKENQHPILLAFNQTLKEKFKITGFPTTLIIDANETDLGRIIGFRGNTTEKEYAEFLTRLAN